MIIRDEVVVDINEEVGVGTEVFLVEAKDQDQGNNGRVVFEIDDYVGGLVVLERETSGKMDCSKQGQGK